MSLRLATLILFCLFARAEAADHSGISKTAGGALASAETAQVILTVEDVYAPNSPWKGGVCMAKGCPYSDGVSKGWLPASERKNKLITSTEDFAEKQSVESKPFIVLVFSAQGTSAEMKAKVREMYKDRNDVAIYFATRMAKSTHSLHQQYFEKYKEFEIPAVAVFQRSADKSWPAAPAGGSALTGELSGVNEILLKEFTRPSK